MFGRRDVAVTKRWKQRPDGSTWSDWGDDDELGRINLLTPEKVLEGVHEGKARISFCLSLPLDFPGGTALNQRWFPPVLAPTEDLHGNPDTATASRSPSITAATAPGSTSSDRSPTPRATAADATRGRFENHDVSRHGDASSV